ncbi:MAG: C39 family peptidase [Desulfobacterales bacterium]|nr:C39 family peptidase [Desulfobacterales bacterium]
MNIINILIIASILLLGCSSDEKATAIQPYEVINKDPTAFFVPQYVATCGATSFYMIFKYYSDHLYQDGYFYKKNCNSIVPLCENIPEPGGITPETCKITKSSKIWKWITTTDVELLWSDLVHGAEDLYYKNQGVCDRYYNIVEYNSEEIGYDKNNPEAQVNTKKRELLNYFTENFLKKNKPILIHIKRVVVAGHYVVIIGYDKKNKKVYYVNPNKEDDDPVIQEVNDEEFIMQKWYITDNEVDGRWDGKWLGFYHE